MNKTIYEKISKDIHLGASIQINLGRINVFSDDIPININWYSENEKEIIANITRELSITAYEYQGYSTGYYSSSNWSGVTLQYIELNTLESSYLVFNAELDRKRSSSKKPKGAKKAAGKFTVSKRSAFFKFWGNADLEIPNNRLSKICERMNWLKPIVFTGTTITKEKLDKTKFKPLEVSQSEIESLFIADNTRTRNGQHTDKTRTRFMDKESEQSLIEQGLEADRSTGFYNYGKRLKGSAVIHNPYTLSSSSKDQTVDEWLSDYEK